MTLQWPFLIRPGVLATRVRLDMVDNDLAPPVPGVGAQVRNVIIDGFLQLDC